jgi:hypothetical protein
MTLNDAIFEHEEIRNVRDALLVMVLTPHILAYLKAHDPMALKQAKEALLAIGENPEPEVLRRCR